jgi:hypothetical protein
MDKIKEEHIKVDEDVIKKENYYSKLREIGEDINSKNSNKKFKDKYKQTNKEGDLKSSYRFMPVGLIKSPNSGEFCKYNLFDEYNNNNKNKNIFQEFLKKKSDKFNDKNFPKRKFSQRTIEYKKNNPFLKHKILNEFISRIK